jgi:hypothetical protein
MYDSKAIIPISKKELENDFEYARVEKDGVIIKIQRKKGDTETFIVI